MTLTLIKVEIGELTNTVEGIESDQVHSSSVCAGDLVEWRSF